MPGGYRPIVTSNSKATSASPMPLSAISLQEFDKNCRMNGHLVTKDVVDFYFVWLPLRGLKRFPKKPVADPNTNEPGTS